MFASVEPARVRCPDTNVHLWHGLCDGKSMPSIPPGVGHSCSGRGYLAPCWHCCSLACRPIILPSEESSFPGMAAACGQTDRKQTRAFHKHVLYVPLTAQVPVKRRGKETSQVLHNSKRPHGWQIHPCLKDAAGTAPHEATRNTLSATGLCRSTNVPPMCTVHVQVVHSTNAARCLISRPAPD